MKISVEKDRKVHTSSSLAGTVNENYYEVLEFTFPEELDNYTKYIEIQAEDLRYVDRIEDNKFTISNALSKYEYLQVQIVCKDLQNNIVYKSNIFTLSTNDSLNIMEDISVEQRDLLDRVELELQEAKEDIEELQETQTEHTEQIQTNTTNIANLQGRVTTNETDIANIKTKNTQQDNAIATNTQDISNIKAEQTTQNTNIAGNTNRITVLEHDSGNKVALNIDSNYVMTLQLLNKNNEVLSTGTIDLPIESMVVNASYSNGVLTLTLQNGQTLNVDISDIVSGLVSETTFNNAIGQLQDSITALQGRMTQAETALQGKVDKVAGKGLSTEDYKTEEKEKLANLENYDDTEVKADIQENTDSIEALETKHNAEVAELQEQLDMTADLIPTGDASGSDITLSDSARYYFKKIVPGGKSEQESYKGTNLCDLNVTQNSKVTYNEDGTLTINGSGDFNINFKTITLKANETYYSRWEVVSGTATGAIFGINGQQQAQNTWASVTPSNDMNKSNFYVHANATFTNAKIKLWISKSQSEYEPYTNGPAPNPDYECPIKNVGDNINIFDITKRLLGVIDDNGDLVIDGTTRKFYEDDFEENTQYTLSGYVKSPSGTVRFKLFYIDGSSTDLVLYNNTNEYKYMTFTTPQNKTLDYISMDYGNTGKMYIKNGKLKLEKGTEATPYSPYNCGNVEVKVENKNLLMVKSSDITPSSWLEYDENSQTFTIKQGSGLVPNSIPININLEVGDTITTSIVIEKGKIGTKEGSALTIGAYHIGSPNSWQGAISIPKNENLAGRTFTKTHTITEEVNAFEIYLYGSPTIDTDIVFEVMIEKGSTATPYVPHEEQTAIFPLEEGQVIHKDDTIEDKIVQRRKTLVFDGTENWSLFFSTQGIFTRSLPNTAANSSSTKNVISNYFIGTNRNYIRNNLATADNLISCFGAELTIANKSITTAADFKAWVAEKYANGTPLTIEYELAEPIETEFTSSQVTAKAQIDKLYSYKGTTHITSEADLDVTYRKDLETMIDKIDLLEARVALLES